MGNISSNIIKEIKKILSTPRKIVILTHTWPDSDAIGSSLGLYEFLHNYGHQVNVLISDIFPTFLNWLPNIDIIKVFSSKNDQILSTIEDAEIFFYIDFNELNRTGDIEPYIRKTKAIKILIDHHPQKEKSIDYSISDTTVSSAAELVFNFIISLGGRVSITKSIAENLLTGIMGDTGCFSFNCSSTKTFKIISSLLEYGINKDKIYDNLYDNFSENRMKLLGYCLNNKLVTIPLYNSAYISLTKEELDRFNFIPGDTEGFVNYPLSIKGIIFSALFIEKKNFVKISFRSKGKFDVNRFAEKNFNGGGHKNAAGGESELSITEAINKFVGLLPDYDNYLQE